VAKALLEGHQEHSLCANESVEMGGWRFALVIVVLVVLLRYFFGCKHALFQCNTSRFTRKNTWVECLWPTAKTDFAGHRRSYHAIPSF